MSVCIAGALTLAAIVASPLSPAQAVVIQISIHVGDFRVSDRWKCSTATREAVYVSSGNTETRARAVLARYASGPITCRSRPIMLFWND